MGTDLRNYQKKDYEELELKDDFMFGKVMQDNELCRRTLEALLEIPIGDVTRLEKQKEIRLLEDRKRIRLDIYVQDMDQTVYDAEMQQRHKKEDKENLPKRTRYYQGMIDLDVLESGVEYQKLRDSYIIFICTFDPFGKKRSKYTFENMCLEVPGLRLDDGATKVFFNTKGNRKDVGPETKKLLDYLQSRLVSNELTRKLDDAVEEARRNEKWRLEYMKERVIYMEAREDGRLDGLEEGHAKGHAEGLAEGRKEAEAEMLVKGVDSIIKKFHVDLSEACEAMECKPEEYEKAKAFIGNKKE